MSPSVTGSPATTPQFAGRAATGATSSAIDATPANPLDNGAIASDYYDQFPAGKQVTGGVVTGGGSESLITALYAYREQAAERGVSRR